MPRKYQLTTQLDNRPAMISHWRTLVDAVSAAHVFVQGTGDADGGDVAAWFAREFKRRTCRPVRCKHEPRTRAYLVILEVI